MVYFSPYFYYKVAGYAVYGLTQTKNITCNVYAVELVHSRDKAFICSWINMWDALTPLWACVFFIFVEPDCYYHFGIIVAIQFVGLVILLGLRIETPRWLLVNGRRDEAIAMLNFIAWFNGAEDRIPADTKFIE